MSVIAHCAVDGQVNLPPEHVLMAPTGDGVSYSWWCPTCWEHRTRPADAPLVALLIRGGVALSGVAPEYAQHDGPALTDDDLDVFLVACGPWTGSSSKPARTSTASPPQTPEVPREPARSDPPEPARER